MSPKKHRRSPSLFSNLSQLIRHPWRFMVYRFSGQGRCSWQPSRPSVERIKPEA